MIFLCYHYNYAFCIIASSLYLYIYLLQIFIELFIDTILHFIIDSSRVFDNVSYNNSFTYFYFAIFCGVHLNVRQRSCHPHGMVHGRQRVKSSLYCATKYRWHYHHMCRGVAKGTLSRKNEN